MSNLFYFMAHLKDLLWSISSMCEIVFMGLFILEILNIFITLGFSVNSFRSTYIFIWRGLLLVPVTWPPTQNECLVLGSTLPWRQSVLWACSGRGWGGGTKAGRGRVGRGQCRKDVIGWRGGATCGRGGVASGCCLVLLWFLPAPFSLWCKHINDIWKRRIRSLKLGNFSLTGKHLKWSFFTD